jgi:hypothetical protein
MAAMAATMPVMTVATVTGPVAVSRGVQTCLRCSRCGGAAAAGRSGSEDGGRWLMVEVEVRSGHGHRLQGRWPAPRRFSRGYVLAAKVTLCPLDGPLVEFAP